MGVGATPTPSPRRLALLVGGAGYLAGAVVMILAILRSPSSTAAIGFLFVPFYAVIPGAVGLLLGACAGTLWQWWRGPDRSLRVPVIVAAASLVVVLGTGAASLAWKLQVASTVARVQQMDATGLSVHFEQGPLRRNRFVLGAMAQNRAADPVLLDAIAHLEDEALHEGMGSLFPLLGENRRGLAVMRLVARHDHVAVETLRWLSKSPDNYVLGDVVGNEKTPVEVLRRLDERGGYLVEWGLARNRRAPAEILHELASSSNEYTRSSVARNPSTPAHDLTRLDKDPIWHVRRDVAMNEAASVKQLERLARDPDEQVSRAAKHGLGRR